MSQDSLIKHKSGINKNIHFDKHEPSDQHSCKGHQNHSHSHKWEIILYFVGLAAFLMARFLPSGWGANLLDFVTVFLAGNHVVIEGITDTCQETKTRNKFYPNLHLLMALAAIGAMFIGQFHEAALLILIFAGAHFLEDYAKNKSKKEITHLLNMNPTKARRLDEEDNVTVVDVNALNIGDIVQILPGDQVPTDGIIVKGIGIIDEASITGESISQEKTTGDLVYGSTINHNSTFTMEVTTESDKSVFGQILRVVEESQANLSPVATKIKKAEPIYVKAILIFVPFFIFGSQLITNWDWYTSFYRGMVALVSSSPCALAAAAIPASLSTISNLAKRGVLFKGSDYLANLGSIQAVAFDKTGTLTAGKPKVTDYIFVDDKQSSYWVDIIVAMEKGANHPLANAIIEKFTANKGFDLIVENQIGQGLSTEYNGSTYSIGKLQKNDQLPNDLVKAYKTYSEAGKTTVLFKENDAIVGLIAMLDTPAKQVKKVIKYLHDHSISTYMITGDNKKTGEAIAQSIGINNVYSNVLPENKAAYIQTIQTQKGLTAMIGDGINDAPALVTSDIGFAMGEGTDVAIEVADSIIMENNLEKFTYAHRLAKKMNRIVKQNIVIALLVVLGLNSLNIFGTINLAISVIFHEGSTLLVILNGLRLLLPLAKEEL
ncbi:heavy metal translocating P-type ATPase [Amphibacillus sp. Q70]|uniref:heavy metal translocating P-type ATPase n=1 Tax=Amphibacillus sp. Q70 TaxID=3453416 RepID=UPI003F82686D